MYNYKKRVRRTILLYIFILFCAGLTFLSLALTAEAGSYKPPSKEYQAAMVLWYTDEGLPQNAFIVDAAYVHILGERNIVIDRNPDGAGVDQILLGGMVDIQYFGYKQVFSNVGGKWVVKEKFNKFAVEFKRVAGDHLKFRKDDRTQ